MYAMFAKPATKLANACKSCALATAFQVCYTLIYNYSLLAIIFHQGMCVCVCVAYPVVGEQEGTVASSCS